jgi:hypothetical protein
MSPALKRREDIKLYAIEEVMNLVKAFYAGDWEENSDDELSCKNQPVFVKQGREPRGFLNFLAKYEY